jgi:hypothetical protein
MNHSTAHEANMVMTGAEKFWWVLGCILSLGGLYFHKISTKRAMLEAVLAHQAYNHLVGGTGTSQPPIAPPPAGPPVIDSPPPMPTAPALGLDQRVHGPADDG